MSVLLWLAYFTKQSILTVCLDCGRRPDVPPSQAEYWSTVCIDHILGIHALMGTWFLLPLGYYK